MTLQLPDADRCYRAVESRDARFDGWFIVGVTSTGIYCRPSCPTPIRPKRENTRFFPTAAAAQRGGFRACKRCRPDAVPGSPEWDVRADLVGRAMRLIADGVVDREGVGGLAGRLAVSERHLHRLLNEVVGAGPIALARAQRAQTSRVLIETTAMSFAEIAFAAGFGSIRQFNDTIRDVFAQTPSQLRAAKKTAAATETATGPLTVRLAVRQPFAAEELVDFLVWHATPGVEEQADDVYRRSLDLPGGPAIAELRPAGDFVECRLHLADLADLTTAVTRCRRLLDLDADPTVVADTLSADPVLAPLVAQRPGLRVPGAVDGFEHAVRTIVGQQISVSGAATVLGRVTAAAGAELDDPLGGVTHRFPRPEELLALDPDELPMPKARARAVRAVSEAVVDGLSIDVGADRDEIRARLLELPGIGPWTAGSVAMRALGDPDAFLANDLVLRKAAVAVGLPDQPKALEERSLVWSPFRAYATHHLWSHVLQPTEEAA